MKEAIQRLLESSQQLHGTLVRSPLWEIVKGELVIVQWIAALGEVESKLKEPSEEDKHLYESK